MNFINVDTSYIPKLPNGPLDEYRSKANVDWKKLRVFWEGEESLKIKYMIWNKLENDILFRKFATTQSIDEQKKITAMQVNRIAELKFLPKNINEEPYERRIKIMMIQNEAFHAIDPSLSIKMALGIGLFTNALLAMGSERHDRIYQAAWNREIVTCLAITEVSHGSNTKRIRTTATYDKDAKEYIINTPDFEAAKCWVGNLGKCASTALVFALLYTPDGVNHGLHGFLVPIRDPYTLKPYPGIIVGDIGEKIGLNGIDNGFIMFDNYRITKDLLLNRTGDVTDDGVYESVFSEPGKILGAALESLSAGRIGIMHESSNTVAHAVVIAVRYAAIRKQFGNDRNGPESSIIEYQLHQWRLFPYLAVACVFKITVNTLANVYLATVQKSHADLNGFELLSQSVSEIHAIVSASKALFTWTTLDAINEARECCGGHGYLKAANIGELRNNHEPTVTYEGDNNVLGQQGSNWLLRQWSGNIESPLGTVNFLKDRQKILESTSFDSLSKALNNNLKSFEFILNCFEWLMCYLLDVTTIHINELLAKGHNKIQAKNDSQVFRSRDISQAFAEYYALRCFKDKIMESKLTPDMEHNLIQIYLIYGFWSLDKHMATFYIGKFASGPQFATFIRSSLLDVCSEIKNSAVAIADSLSPPDWVLNSVLGQSNGELYENLKNSFMNNPGALDNSDWAAIVGQRLSSKL